MPVALPCSVMTPLVMNRTKSQRFAVFCRGFHKALFPACMYGSEEIPTVHSPQPLRGHSFTFHLETSVPICHGDAAAAAAAEEAQKPNAMQEDEEDLNPTELVIAIGTSTALRRKSFDYVSERWPRLRTITEPFTFDGMDATIFTTVYPSGYEETWIDITYEDALGHSATFNRTRATLLRAVMWKGALAVRNVVWLLDGTEEWEVVRTQARLINSLGEYDRGLVWNNVMIVKYLGLRENEEFFAEEAAKEELEATSMYTPFEINSYRFNVVLVYEPPTLPNNSRTLYPDIISQIREALLNSTSQRSQTILPTDLFGPQSRCTKCNEVGDARAFAPECHSHPFFYHKVPVATNPFHPMPIPQKQQHLRIVMAHRDEALEDLHIGSLVPGKVKGWQKVRTVFNFNIGSQPHTGEHYSCCNGNVDSPGCTPGYVCCRRPQEWVGCEKMCMDCGKYPRFAGETCRLFYPCCGVDAEPEVVGCKNKFQCCGLEEDSVGCMRKCSDCHGEWGESKGCSRRNEHMVAQIRMPEPHVTYE